MVASTQNLLDYCSQRKLPCSCLNHRAPAHVGSGPSDLFSWQDSPEQQAVSQAAAFPPNSLQAAVWGLQDAAGQALGQAAVSLQQGGVQAPMQAADRTTAAGQPLNSTSQPASTAQAAPQQQASQALIAQPASWEDPAQLQVRCCSLLW